MHKSEWQRLRKREKVEDSRVRYADRQKETCGGGSLKEKRGEKG